MFRVYRKYFAAADVTYHFFEERFFDKYIQICIIEDFTTIFNYSCADQPRTASFTTLME